ncbi:MAG: hypothetical protein AAGI48_13830 [Verrucomicrobiota bacterium]
MKHSISFILVCIVLVGGLMLSAVAVSEVRTWTSREGVTIEGVLAGVDGENVVLKDRKGQEFRVPPTGLIEEDQRFIEEWRKVQEELELNYEGPGKRKTPEKVQLRLCRIALDITFNCFDNTFGQSMKKTEAAVDRILTELNRVWIPEAGIQFEIGNLEVRTTIESDPYQATRVPGALLGMGRELNAEHRCDVVFVMDANADHGGGIGGGRGVWIAWGGDAWDLMHHEFSHALGTSHGDGWPMERGTMNQTSWGSRYPRERRHTLNYREVELIREYSGNLKEIGFTEEKVAPYATLDRIRLKKPRATSGLGAKGGKDHTLDPLFNDYDLNGGEVMLKDVDRRSTRGAKLTKLKDGRVRYQLDEPFSEYFDYDFFHYEIEDEDGMTSRGAVVLFFEQAELIVKNGDFSEGKRGWKMDQAEVVTNGESITSVQIDHRALIQPGGEIVQEVELDRRLSDKYLLEATIFTGTEKDENGSFIDPPGDPDLIVGIYSSRNETKRRIDETDVTIGIPIQLKTNTLGGYEVRFTNAGDFPIRVGHVVLRPVD